MEHNYTPEEMTDIEAERSFYERRLQDDDFFVTPHLMGGTKHLVFIKPSDLPRLKEIFAYHAPRFERLSAIFAAEPPKWRIFAHRRWERELEFQRLFG